MKINVNNFEIDIEENQSDIKGLKFVPQIKNFGEDANDADCLPFTQGFFVEVSSENFILTEDLTKRYAKYAIVEIGVNRNGKNSFTWAMLENKPKDVIYLGIDLEDKSDINDKQKNIYTIKSNSFDQETVRKYMKEIGLDKISILFIDGNHSINAVINDWKYTDLLAEDGVVIFHDTNYHPGPRIFMETIDDKFYKIEKYFTNSPGDCGMGVAYKI